MTVWVVGEEARQFGVGELEEGVDAGGIDIEGVGDAGGVVALGAEAQGAGIVFGELVEGGVSVHRLNVRGWERSGIRTRY